MNDPDGRQGMVAEHGAEARPGHVIMSATP